MPLQQQAQSSVDETRLPQPPPTVMILGSYGPSMVRFRLPLIAGLRRHGCKVIASVPLNEMGQEDSHILEALGVILADAPVARHSLSFIEGLRYTFHVAKLLKDHRVDGLVAYTAKPVIFGTFAARATGVDSIVPLVTGLGTVFTGEATSASQRAVRFVVARLYRRALSMAGCAFFQNPDDPRDLAALGGLSLKKTRVEFIPGSGVDLRHFAMAAQQSTETGLVFLMIARILADKGVREFAEAAAIVRERNAKARFLLVGPFDHNPSGVSPAEVQGWKHVEYLGPVDDVRPILASCHVYVCPTSALVRQI